MFLKYGKTLKTGAPGSQGKVVKKRTFFDFFLNLYSVDPKTILCFWAVKKKRQKRRQNRGLGRRFLGARFLRFFYRFL